MDVLVNRNHNKSNLDTPADCRLPKSRCPRQMYSQIQMVRTRAGVLLKEYDSIIRHIVNRLPLRFSKYEITKGLMCYSLMIGGLYLHCHYGKLKECPECPIFRLRSVMFFNKSIPFLKYYSF